jgi:hypothetical protein
MHKQEADRTVLFRPNPVTTNHQFREALARIRVLEGVKSNTAEGRERAALEIAVSRFLSAGMLERH